MKNLVAFLGLATLLTLGARAEDVTLVYDHSEGRWKNPAGARVKFDINGIPTVYLRGGEGLRVVVGNTNPLLYTVSRGEATASPIPKLEELKTLAALIAKGITSFVAVSTQFTEDARKSRAGYALAGGFDQQLGELSAAARAVEADAASLGCAAEQAEQRTREAVLFIQQVELGSPGTYDPEKKWKCTSPGVTPPSLAEAREAFQRLSSNQAMLVRPPACVAVVSALESLLKIDPANAASVAEAIFTYRTASLASRSSSCAGLEAFRKNADQLVDDYEGNAAGRAALVAAHRPVVSAIADVIARQKALADSVGTLLEQEDELNRARAKLAIFEKALKKHLAADRSVADAGSLAEVTIPVGEHARANWEEVQNYPFTIRKGGVFAADVEAARDESVDTAYRLAAASADYWDFGISIVHTGVKNPEFGVGPGETEGQQVIVVTDETTRSGELAMFADWAAGAAWADRGKKPGSFLRRVGLQVGAAVSDDPALFVGPSLRLGRFVRLGGGVTLQRVKELRGQVVGDPVGSADEIRRRDVFDSGGYLSLSISIGSIDLFGGD